MKPRKCLFVCSVLFVLDGCCQEINRIALTRHMLIRFSFLYFFISFCWAWGEERAEEVYTPEPISCSQATGLGWCLSESRQTLPESSFSEKSQLTHDCLQRKNKVGWERVWWPRLERGIINGGRMRERLIDSNERY